MTEETNMHVTTIPVGMLGTNCYLLTSKSGNCIVIDPGAQPDKLIQVIEQRELKPKYILLTHGHYDHIGGVKKLMQRYPEIEMYISEGDAEVLTDPAKSNAVSRGMAPEDAYFDEVSTAKEGDTFTLDELTVGVLETPGHTKGGLTFVCGELMFTGDTLFRGDVGRTDLYGGSYQVLKQSLAKLCAQPGDYTVYPGHGDSSTLEYERKFNRYINE